METFYVIVGQHQVYGAFNNKICAISEFKNQNTQQDAENEVKAIVFGYAENRLNVYLKVVRDNNIKTSNCVFRFLEKDSEIPKKNLALLENGYVHTRDLSQEDADEMLERHSRFFPDEEWSITVCKD